MRKCYKQRCASKTAKKTLSPIQCVCGCNSIHKSINDGLNRGLIEVFVNYYVIINDVTLPRRHRNVIPMGS